MKYEQFKYLYPPRPEFKAPAKDLHRYDTGEYIAQPKYNGSCAIVFTNGTDLHIYNRHKEQLTKVSPAIEFKKLAKTPGKWYVYTGEYLNKSKLGETGQKEKDKFVIWDILVWEGEYLIGSTLNERLELLENIYPCKRAVINEKLEIYDHLCCTEFTGIYKAPTYLHLFKVLYDDLVKTDLYEGLVLKKLTSRLTYGYQEANNRDWQIKCRKETKNYQF